MSPLADSTTRLAVAIANNLKQLNINMVVIDSHPDHWIRNRLDKQHQNQCRGLYDLLETSRWFKCPRRGCKLPAEHEHTAGGGVYFRSAAVVREMVARMKLGIKPRFSTNITK